MKKLLLFSLSLSILCFTAYAGYYLWKEDKAKAERIEKEDKAREEKRERLNKYYEFELKCALTIARDPKTNAEQALLKWDEIEEIKKHMLQDGYDRAEIAEIDHKAYREASILVKNRSTLKK